MRKDSATRAAIWTFSMRMGRRCERFSCTICIASAALGDSVQGSLQYNTLFAVGLTLFAITLVINVISIRLVNRFREVY